MARPQYPPPPLLDPGWYRDPTARFEARYWDGAHWTSHISHYGATGSDPMLAARFDRAWIRWSARLVGWALVAGIAWLAFDRFWPSDERDVAADQEMLEASVLVSSDLPSGYTRPAPGPASPLWHMAADSAPPEPCPAVVADLVDLTEEPKIWNGYATAAGDFVANSIVVLSSDSAADDYLDELRADTTGDCLASLWADLAASGASGTVVSSSVRAMGDPSFGDAAVWWRMEGEVVSGAVGTPVFADVLIVRVDRVASQYTFGGVSESIGVEVQRAVIVPHVSRITQALAGIDEARDADAPG